MRSVIYDAYWAPRILELKLHFCIFLLMQILVQVVVVDLYFVGSYLGSETWGELLTYGVVSSPSFLLDRSIFCIFGDVPVHNVSIQYSCCV